MSATLTLYELPPSPNCMKARIALNFKGLPYQRVEVDPMDRSELLRLSGQPLTPLLMHGELPVWDSAAILRHLDSSFRDTPRLYAEDPELHHQIEHWENFGRSALLESFVPLPSMFFRGVVDEQAAGIAAADFLEQTSTLEKALTGREYLCGERMSAADVTCAPLVWYAMLPEDFAAKLPVAAFLRQHLELGADRANCRAWVSRVMPYWR